VKKAAIALLCLLACNSPAGIDSFDISKQPSPTPPTIPPQAAVDRPFDFTNLRGYSAFALVMRSREERIALLLEARSHGFNTCRVCAETEFWDEGPDEWHPHGARNLAALQEFLDDAARIEGVQVILIANCTLRDAVPISEQLAWDAKVRELVLASRYQNIAIEVVNEFWHPDSLTGKVPVASAIQAWRAAGYPAGSDDSVCLGDFTLEHRLRNTGASFYSFNPCRTVGRGPWDPDAEWLSRLKLANPGGPILISESVCYADPNDFGGLCTDDKSRIQAAFDAAKKAGIGWVYHGREGLRARPPYSYWPN